jgi:hypothetical protein
MKFLCSSVSICGLAPAKSKGRSGATCRRSGWRGNFTAMRTWLPIAILFLLTPLAASACPSCTNDRLLAQHWHIKYLLVSLIVPMIIVANRLDLVRFAFVLIPYVAFAFQFHQYLFWHSFPGTTLVAQLGWAVWGFNLVGAVMLYVVSRFTFFRWRKDQGLAGWQPVGYVAAMFIAQVFIR